MRDLRHFHVGMRQRRRRRFSAAFAIAAVLRLAAVKLNAGHENGKSGHNGHPSSVAHRILSCREFGVVESFKSHEQCRILMPSLRDWIAARTARFARGFAE